MKILVINCGSSSIKYQLFDMEQKIALASGLVERIGEAEGRITHHRLAGAQPRTVTLDAPIADHHVGLARMADLIMDPEVGVIASAAELAAIGHRVVHGGERFSASTVIDDEVIEAIQALSPFAPLHNPPNLAGIQVARELFPQAIQVAVFDTAYHQTLPAAAYRYAIPTKFYEEDGIRVYGFHGTSHLYVARLAAHHLGIPFDRFNAITLHLGNGASMAAVENGRSVDTSMGFTPLAGLIMGTRSGDLDPAVVYFMGTRLGLSFKEIDRILNKQSGLLGLCNANDLRDIERRREEGDAAATLALDMYAYRIKKYIGAYMAVLGRVDALVFTAGVGENSSFVRAHACAGLELLGVSLDAEKNATAARGELSEIQAADSRVKVLVAPTNEELEIANQTLAVVRGRET
jgi:acetate kinase